MMWIALPLTVLLYLMLRELHSRFNSPLLNPVLWTIIISAVLMTVFSVDVADYSNKTAAFGYLLELAVVALAIPLYKQVHQLKRQMPAIILSVSAGIILATTIAYTLASLFAAPEQLKASLATLSVTTPITLLVTQQLGGIGSIAASMVILIGVVGAVVGFSVLRFVGVQNKSAQGLALGAACHGIGTATAIADNEVSAAYASSAMAISAILTPIITPVYYPFLVQLTS